jgi:hypothetical protein
MGTIGAGGIMKKLSDIVTPEEFRLCDATSEEIKLSREFMQEWKRDCILHASGVYNASV